MIPVCDVVPAPSRPLVTFALMATGVASFLVLGPAPASGAGTMSLAAGWLPVALNAALATVRPADGLTLAATVVALWLFGPTVEDRLGRGRYALLYFGAGLLAAGCMAVAGLAASVGRGGPAAAVGAVVAAHLSLYPRGRTLMLVPDVSGFDFVDVPSALLAGFWFLAQLLSAGAHLGLASGWSPVAALGHLSLGAIVGGAAVHALKRRERMHADWWGRLS